MYNNYIHCLLKINTFSIPRLLPVMPLAEHLAVRRVRLAALMPRRDMVRFHFI